MNDPWFAITMAAANLKVAVPEQFDALLKAFQLLDSKLVKDLKSAGPDGIFNAQGQAVLAEKLKDRLEKCLEQRAEYQRRK